MRTKLTIDCDIIDAQNILYKAKKIISEGERNRDQERLDELIRAGVIPEPRITPNYEDVLTAEVTCPKCNWYGRIAELRVLNSPIDTHCPKCNTVIKRMNQGINVYKFIALDDDEKGKYNCIDENGDEYDISVFDREKDEMSCELCGLAVNTDREKLIGTSDTREPKFCYIHYIEINARSRFIRREAI